MWRMSKLVIKILILLLLLPVGGFAFEYKELKELKKCVKTSNVGKGRELINKCLKDTLINCNAQFYALAAAIEIKANDSENMKLYLRQNYDTASFFNTTCNIFEYLLKQESLLEESNSKEKAKVQKRNRETLKAYYPNLYSGGIFFVKNKKWESAQRLLSMYIDVTRSASFENEKYITYTRLPRAAFWSMTACYEAKLYKDVFKYCDIAEEDSANFDYVLQYESLSYAQLADTARYVSSLKRGLEKSSSSDFFFSRLTDLFNEMSRYQEAISLNDSLLAIYPDNKLYLYAQTVALFNIKAYDKCLGYAQKLYDADSTNVQACYYLGLCWYNKAISFESTLSPNPTSQEYREMKKEVERMFQRALPYFEKTRAVLPEDKDKWQAPLYKIYFSLNLADKLRELEK